MLMPSWKESAEGCASEVKLPKQCVISRNQTQAPLCGKLNKATLGALLFMLLWY